MAALNVSVVSADQEVWSGEVLLDGDVTVPAGRTLIIQPGTRVRMASVDRLRFARSPGFSRDLASQFTKALIEESRHVDIIKTWLNSLLSSPSMAPLAV